MSVRRNWIIDALAAVTIATLLVAGFALAHPASDFYPAKWQRDRSVEWRFDNEFPGGDFRDSVEFGARQWNELGPNMHFDKQTPEYGGFPAAECPDRYQKDGIHWGAIDGQHDTLAVTYRCVFAADRSELYSFQIKFDQAENWQRGPGDPGPNEADARSVAAHEFGHATGFAGHFNNDSNACTEFPIHTMCPFHTLGTTRQRSLEEHDRHTFNNAY